MEENDTIAALSTGKGNAAMAIIRISGKKAFEKLGKLMKPEKRFLNSAPKEIHCYQFYDLENKRIVDGITAIKYASPRSFTGENMVEILCHGGEIVVEEILSCLLRRGIRLAKRGEFTKRAFLNGKVDILQAEAIGQIIQCNSKKQYQRAIEIYNGNGERKIGEWKEKIKSILVDCEAAIEFPDEDDILSKKSNHIKKIKDVYSDIKKEIKSREKIKTIENGIAVPIVGIANAGKSTLFNKIVGFERVLVHHEEGTTRDAISEEILIGGERITLIDTAGISETKNEIEKMGIKKSWENIEKGSIIIWVTPANQKINEIEKGIIKKIKKRKILGIVTKKDLNTGEEKEEILKKMGFPYIVVSLIEEKESNKIQQFIINNIEKSINESEIENGIICTKRQEELLLRTIKKFERIRNKENFSSEEIISHELKNVLKDLDEFVGETTNENILNEIFNQFCIGK